jgi:hypothetical protein
MSEKDPAQTKEAFEQTLETPTAAPLAVPPTGTPVSRSNEPPPSSNNFPRSFPQWRRGFWFVAVWHRIRPILIELSVHVLVFGLLLGSLIIFHFLIEYSELPPGQKEILDKVHFYGSILALIIYTISFIIKALLLEFRGKHDD